MAKIRAPFNFVPISDEVYFPDWSDKIYQDIPFKDGVSGIIELKIIAESPMFVRNGHTKNDADDKNNNLAYKSFSNINNKYFIPSTTIKGAIRNVLEIISFSKMNLIDDKRFSIRDIRNHKYRTPFQQNDVHCGWMYSKGGNKIYIDDLGIPGRISYEQIDDIIGTNFKEIFTDINFGTIESEKSPWFKYDKVKDKNLMHKFAIVKKSDENPVDTRQFVCIDNVKGKEGTIVFTGQPSKRNVDQQKGKFYDFVFFNDILGTHELDRYDKKGSYQDFCFINKDSEIWARWRKRMQRGEKVPVFFIPSADNSSVEHFGLSYLYKLPFKKRTKGYLPKNHQSDKLDLAECIFGASIKGLKGRVQFSHAFQTKGEVLKEKKVYLGSPKPTYYPIYLKQEGKAGYIDKGYKTMLDDNAQLRGFKRYPVHKEVIDVAQSIPENQDNNANPFIPVASGAEFVCKVRFHNLKRVELGALFKAIEFDENGYHTIGSAKSYGYGKTRIKITNITGIEEDKSNLIKEFEEKLASEIDKQYIEETLKELKLMSKVQALTAPLEYMELEEFAKHKNHNPRQDIYGAYQQPFSELIIPKTQEPTKTTHTARAMVISDNRRFLQAELIDNDKYGSSLPLVVKKGKSFRPKYGQIIEVEYTIVNGKVKELNFIRKIKN